KAEAPVRLGLYCIRTGPRLCLRPPCVLQDYALQQQSTGQTKRSRSLRQPCGSPPKSIRGWTSRYTSSDCTSSASLPAGTQQIAEDRGRPLPQSTTSCSKSSAFMEIVTTTTTRAIVT